MEVVPNNTLLPGDPRLIEHIVCELKSQGIFDQFRKECIDDVDTKPAYQNLRQRVEGSVTGFLKTQAWRPDMNKNQLREMLRKNIYESGFLETGVERIVDQVVYPKINSVFLPQVEDVVYNFLGLEKPVRTISTINGPLTINTIDLLPTDLDPISPDSEVMDKSLNKSDKSNDETDKLDDSKNDEFESPPFEPITEQSVFSAHEESSNDSHLSGISGLTSHDSNMSCSQDSKLNIFSLDATNQDSQLSKVSSNSRLSIITTDSKHNSEKMDISDDTQTSKNSKLGEESNLDIEETMEKSENGVSHFNIKRELTDEIDAIRIEISEHQNGEKEENNEEMKNEDQYDVEMDIDEDSQMSNIESQDVKILEQEKTFDDESNTEEINKESLEKEMEELKMDVRVSEDSIKLELEKEFCEETNKVVSSEENISKEVEENGSREGLEDQKTEDSRDSVSKSDLKVEDSSERDADLKKQESSDEASKLEVKKQESSDDASKLEVRKQESSDDASKLELKKSDAKSDSKSDSKSERSRHDSDRKHSSRNSESKDKKDDRKSDKDRKEKDRNRSTSSSKDKDKYRDKSKDNRTKDKDTSKSKDEKDKTSKLKEDKDKESSKSSSKDDKSRSSSSSKYSRDRSNSKSDSKSSKDSRDRSKPSTNSKSKDDKPKSEESKSSKSDDTKKSDSSKKAEDLKRSSKSEETKSSSKSEESKSSSSSSRSRDRSRSDTKHSDNSSSRDRKSSSSKDHKDRKESKKSSKRDKDDHSSSKDKKTDNRRSADRDSNDGSSGIGNNSNSNSSKEKESSSVKSSENSTDSSQGSNSGDSGQSDNSQTSQCLNQNDDSAAIKAPVKILTEPLCDKHEITISPAKDSDSDTAQHVKIMKPKFASNIFEARRLMKVRKKLEKLEKKRQRQLIEGKKDRDVDGLSLEDTDSVDSGCLQIVEQDEPKNDIKLDNTTDRVTIKDESNSAPTTSVVSKESWDALEAKLSLNVDYDSYIDENCDSSSSTKHPRRSSDEEDCLYFVQQTSPKIERYLKKVASLQRDGAELAIVLEDCRKMAPPHMNSEMPAKRARKTNQKYMIDEGELKETITNKKTTVADGKNSAMIKKKAKGRKRKLDGEMDGFYLDNNNKKTNNHFDVTDMVEDYEEVLESSPSASNTSNGSIDLTTKIKPPVRSKKAKKIQNETFPLPLSPESDVSASSIEVRNVGQDKDVIAPARTPRASIKKSQRYSSDDLYKPRPFVSGSSRRQRGLLNSTDNVGPSARLRR